MNKVVSIIIEFINAVKEGKRVECFDNGICYAITSPKYILGQIIRHYSLSWDHYYISKSAKDLWESITDEPMGKYWYKNIVECQKDGPITIRIYKGNSNSFETKIITKGSKFAYNDVFHYEHITTISDITNELISLEDINEENVMRVLDELYVCRMLKSEDRLLKPKVHRGSTNVDEVIKKVYGKMVLIKDYFLEVNHM